MSQAAVRRADPPVIQVRETRVEHRPGRTLRRGRGGPVRLNLWIPVALLWVVIGPLALITAPLAARPLSRWRRDRHGVQRLDVNPGAAIWAIASLLPALSGTTVEIDTPTAQVRIRLF